jgi:hypothetical protein
MGLSFDGVNPFSMQRSMHSTWPVLIILYNLSPWMVTKKFSLSLNILISGKEASIGNNIDVFLQPLYEELLKLWEGVDVVDTSLEQKTRNFWLRGLLLWTVSDFPTYGLIFEQQYSVCLVCRLAVNSRSMRGPKKTKIIFLGSRRWLPPDHSYHTNLTFDGLCEHKPPPR